MVQFIKANDEKLLDDRKFLAKATYNTGIVAARAFIGKPLRFEDLYNFPKPKKTPAQIRAELMAWAIQVQNSTRKDK